MEWCDEGLLLSSRRHGESSVIIEVLTAGHGRHAGLVQGGASRRLAPVLQPGAQLDLTWRARLDDHLGTYRVEPLQTRASALMAERPRLAAFNAMSALILALVPDRAPDPVLYDLTMGLTGTLADRESTATDQAAHYAAWELGLLATLGFRLDLSECAATGSGEDLIWVSPKSGRAVSRRGAAGWEDRLLALPPFLKGGVPTQKDAEAALRLTGHFLTHWVLPATNLTHLPEARARLIDLVGR